ncbi:trk system potassium uptake protein TrkA [Parabacteroides sp. PF5-5]|uniref:Trk system potassium transporter TrkA n=1 Tax=unclassified Parabacteroides TaxID=2649774 RepID=UPI002475315B|nr:MULTISPECIES: Trk system potassium transporter TrkA [unclassified Parabacteroides]MDH6306638.1 trk system potassium uptake protein TrkA [Parabacteroides sp. PH5-39]MDH6317605.1 trk system potassium uptake protein TrkA [Parabacteroides sp. PF5-13]MDH6321349.1 trk system potassium uptake protein TrkA [Parabacteroides sp. PH5-13]MDH6325086.1 trk system potassium uptake protein TrkA [Parabacteroides sp. PH5-8]MDH6328795.1 trk system potassium uptake protein TrkA [Parabacteroides sp. PH5-41]
MKIVIAGAGEVGTYLAKMLAQENLDIILMDPDEERLQFPTSGAEILPMVGNPTSPRDLNEAGIKNADLFVSVTPEESTNIAACILATNLGAHKTFARINNFEYLLPKNKELLESLGISFMIYPEMLAAREIVTAIKRPWTRQYFELSGGAIILIGVKIRENSQLVNMKLAELPGENKSFHIVAIKRKNETIIPRGSDQVLPGDLVFFTTTKEHIKDIQIQAGKANPEVKKIFIMGGSRIALRACQYLPGNIRIKVIELNKEKSHRIAEVVPSNVLIINGDGRNLDLLIQEGIKDAQAFVALTENESTNILACLAAKRYGVVKTIAKIENLDYIPLAESMDIGAVINKKLIAASHIYQFLLDADVSNVKSLAFASADVAELVARPNSKITRKPVKDLSLPKDLTLGGLIRDGEPMMINGNTQIQAYDNVVVFCMDTAIRKLEDYFN